MSSTRFLRHIPIVIIYLAPFVALLALGAVLNMTNPIDSGPVSILVVFVMLYLLILSVLAAVLHLVGAIIRMVRPQQGFSLRRGYYVLSIVSLAPVLLVALNTLGQLELLEIVLILILVGLGCFYVVRRTAK